MKKVYLFFFTFFLFACGGKKVASVPDKIKVENKLGKKIVCVFGYDYPDTGLSFISKKELLADTGLLQLDSNQIKEIDTVGLCKKDVWGKYVRQSLLMLIVLDKKKLLHAKNPEDAVIERYYFSYTQLIKDKGLIVVY